MKKNLYYLILLLYTLVNYSQSGKITYSIRTFLDTKVEIKENIKEYVTSLYQKADKLQYELCFNKTQSSFKNINNNMTDDKDNITAKLIICAEDMYIDHKEKTIITQTIDNTLIKKKTDSNNWVISTETKKIDNYLCYKAIQTINFIDRKGKNKTREIVAWFAPTIPYSYGPKNYANLPGLILELQDSNVIFYTTNIKISANEVAINFPKGKTISQEEYDNQLKTQMGM